MRGLAWVCVPLLAGCFSAYEGGALVGGPQGRQLGCLDVRVGLIEDPAADPSWSVVGVDMGNRCDGPVYVDLRRVVVTGRLADGRLVRLRPYDPDREIDEAVLDGRMRAHEVIAYVPPATAVGFDRGAREVCVDVTAITDADPAQPVCFESREGT